MPLIKDEGAKPNIKRKTVNLPNFHLKKGEQVHLGVHEDGTSKLIPWNYHFPTYKRKPSYSNTQLSDGQVRPIEGINDPTDSQYMAKLTTINTTAQPSKTTWTHNIPGTDAIFMFSATSETSAYGAQGVGFWVVKLDSEQTLDCSFSQHDIPTGTTGFQPRSLSGYYVGDDATYWYYLCVYVRTDTSAEAIHHVLARVNKTTFAVDDSNVSTSPMNPENYVQGIRLDTTNERLYMMLGPDRNEYYFYLSYSTSTFSTSAIVVTSRAATVETWGAVITDAATSSEAEIIYIIDPDNYDRTYQFVFNNDADNYADYSIRSNIGMNTLAIFVLDWDGTKWQVSQSTETEYYYFSGTPREVYGYGGGYFRQNSYPFYINPTTGKFRWLRGNDENKFPCNDYEVHGGETIDALPWGQYFNGVFYSNGDAYVDGELRSGIDAKYIRAMYGDVNYGSRAATYDFIFVLKEDADYLYGSYMSGVDAGTNTYLYNAWRAPKPCMKISRGPIARAVTDSVPGAYGMNILRLSGIPSDGETVTVGSQTYTFKTALTPTAGEVLIGASAAASANNLSDAFHQQNGSGSLWAASTPKNTQVTAIGDSLRNTMNLDDFVYFRTIEKTDAVISCSETGANMAFDHATMQNGAPGGDVVLDIYEGVEYAEGTSDTYQTYDNETYEMKPVVGVYDTTHVEVGEYSFKSIVCGAGTTSIGSLTAIEHDGIVYVESQQGSISQSSTMAFNPQRMSRVYAVSAGNKIVYGLSGSTTENVLINYKIGKPL